MYQRQKRLWNKIIDAAHEIDKHKKMYMLII